MGDRRTFGPEIVRKNMSTRHGKRFRADCEGWDREQALPLKDAVASRRAAVTGEMTCQGWLSRAAIGSVHCRNILRYRFKLKY